MKNSLRISGAALVAAAGLAVCAFLSAPAAGTVVSDAQAATITGGCTGIEFETCSGGRCSAQTVVTTGNKPGYNATGLVYCGGTTSCDCYSSGVQACGS